MAADEIDFARFARSKIAEEQLVALPLEVPGRVAFALSAEREMRGLGLTPARAKAAPQGQNCGDEWGTAHAAGG